MVRFTNTKVSTAHLLCVHVSGMYLACITETLESQSERANCTKDEKQIITIIIININSLFFASSSSYSSLAAPHGARLYAVCTIATNQNNAQANKCIATPNATIHDTNNKQRKLSNFQLYGWEKVVVCACARVCTQVCTIWFVFAAYTHAQAEAPFACVDLPTKNIYRWCDVMWWNVMLCEWDAQRTL